MYTRELEVAIFAIKEASKVVMDVYRSSDFEVEIKSDNSPVTRADKLSDAVISKILKNEFPSYAILTEESIDNKERLNNDYVWIVDPVDGTKDFVNKNDEFTINIGLSYKKRPVLGVIMIPAKNEYYYATSDGGAFHVHDGICESIHVNDKTEDLTVLMSVFHTGEKELDAIKRHSDKIKHIRSVGSSIKGCVIAQGDAELSFRFSSNTKEWDTCAMQAILEEAGGFILRFDGKPIVYNKDDVYNHDGYVVCNNKKNFIF